MQTPPDQADLYIGAMVRTLRMARGKSQRALGDSLGVSFQQIQKYETGANRVSAVNLLRIAKQLDFPVLAFLPDDPDDPFRVLYEHGVLKGE